MTIFGEHASLYYGIVLILNFLVIQLILNECKSKFLTLNHKENENSITTRNLEVKIIKLSIHLYRASVFIITSVAIIAVDFKIFPRVHAKTSEFGIYLMTLFFEKSKLY